MPNKYSDHYIRAGTVPIERVLPYVGRKMARWYYGHKCNLSSDRLVLFKEKVNKLHCVVCGLKGLYFAVERHSNTHTYHLNLYAIDKDGNEMLMTKDHIKPVCKGGKNYQGNYQVMCVECNCKKGARYV